MTKLYVGTYREPIATVNNAIAQVAAKYDADAFVNVGGNFGGRYDIETLHYSSLAAAMAGLDVPTLVAVETGGDLLQDFTPPADDILYLFGAQTGSLPAHLDELVDYKVTIETPGSLILPTPICAGIVLHHDYLNVDVRV